MTFVITFLYLLVAVGGAIFATFELRLLLRFLKHRNAIRDSVHSNGKSPGGVTETRPTVLPSVTIQIPLYNERTSATRVIRAAAAQSYPADRFDIQVLDDSTDETSEIVRQEVKLLRAQGISIQHHQRGNRIGFKAGALAEGMRHSTSEFLAIFDADFAPDPHFLRRLLEDGQIFADPKVAFVQTRWSWRDLGGVFHSAISLLMDRHFFVQKPTKAFFGDVTVFNGSAGIWRREAIDHAGGWSADTLTEDLDLSYRCALAGWQGRYLHDVSVPNDLPANMRAFKLQQHRWARGNAQCFRKLVRKVVQTEGVLRDRWEEAHILAGYAIHPVLVANLLLWPFAVLYVDRTLFLVFQSLLSFFTLVAPLSFLLTLRERGDRITPSSLWRVGVGVCVGIGLMVVNTVGQIQGFLSAKGEFARTPKAPPVISTADPKGLGTERAYESPLHWTFFVELLMLAYCAGGIFLLIERGELLWAFPLFFWGICLAIVVLLQFPSTATRDLQPVAP